ncbi:potassium channel subfamily K member 17 [Ambystoma mexicanum]|uniref:potassium channel subfamily K member 17 n=1 Tax=Ambystoma mexicanum TaxID=8296 RepID=UPI0037E7904A
MPSCYCPQVPTTLLLLLLYIAYLLMGAGVFWALESGVEVDTALHLQELLRTQNFTCMDNQTLRRFIEGIIEAYKNGITLDENTTTMGKWKFEGSFFFSVSAITTIGYGNLSPDTVSGRIFCIFFALFGIPLNLILLNRIGQWMLSWVHRCADALGRKLRQQRMAKALTSSCALLTGLLLFFLLPPLMFTSIEGWTYDEAFYYAFITLSTIGFGDYVIGMNPSIVYPSWYKNVVALWILFGMAWLALIINLCISLCESYGGACKCCQKRTSKELELELMDMTQNGNLHPVLQDSEDSESCSSKDTKSENPD